MCNLVVSPNDRAMGIIGSSKVTARSESAHAHVEQRPHRFRTPGLHRPTT